MEVKKLKKKKLPQFNITKLNIKTKLFWKIFYKEKKKKSNILNYFRDFSPPN